MEEILKRHDNIALQLSGGRDSIACLYLMKPYWDKLTVYWLDGGAAYPETVALMRDIEQMVPRFVRVQGQQPQSVEQWGMPTDILPASATPMGVAGSGTGTLMQDRYTCCLRSIMLPMHAKMVEDGITLIIRGQKNADRMKSVIRSGDVDNGIEYLFPIEDWDTRKVMSYLREQKAPIPRFYEMLNSAPDCMTCTAWWEEGAMHYLHRYHHEQFKENQARMDVIRQQVDQHIFAFNKEFSL